MDSSRTRPAVTTVGVALLSGALAAAATTAVALAAPQALAGSVWLVAGVLALAGVPVLLLVAREPGPLPPVRATGLPVAVLAGLGGILVGVQSLASRAPLPYPVAGDLVCAAALPFVALGVLRLPRASGGAVRLGRLVPVALCLAGAIALAVWGTALAGGGPSPVGATSVLLTLLVAFVALLLVMVAVVGRQAVVTRLLASACLLAPAYLVGAFPAGTGGVPPLLVVAPAVCLGWPMLWAAVLLVPATLRPLDPAERAAAETRSLVVTTVSISLAGVLVVLGIGAGPTDRVTALLIAVIATGVVVQVVVTQRQQLAQVLGLLHLTEHDPVTGLGNRRALATTLAAAGGGGAVGVAVLNLDGFSAVNDRLGHRGGDAVLVAVAAALRHAVPADVALFRLGGDEFALVAPLGGEAMVAVATTARGAVVDAGAPVPGMRRVRLASSCGVHSAPLAVGAGDPLAALGPASSALQAARRAGRDRLVVWSEDLAVEDRRREVVQARLRLALRRGDLQVHLQPVVDVATGRTCAFEALSRWTDAELGPVSPVEFVAVAEATGLVVELGRQVMASALAALVSTGGLAEGMSVAVNASPAELRHAGFVAGVADALAAHGVPADLLVVEVTESIFVDAQDPAVGALDELAGMGVQVAVDDFGTGYSSLSYLTRLPVHELKIDRSLTSRLHEAPMHAVVTALVAMADALGLAVVAEGVEEESQAAALRAMGVTYGQGWLWSRALPVADAAALLGRQCGRSAPGPAARAGASTGGEVPGPRP